MGKLLPLLCLLVAIIVGLYVNTLRTTPNASVIDIEADGGYGLHHKGRVIEYFLYGDPKGVPLIFIHGASSTGSIARYMDGVSKEYGHRLISISLPGNGGTSPIYGRGYFEPVEDVLVVLEHLGYTEKDTLHIMGTSFGSGHAAAVAITLAKRVRSLQLVVPFWPSMADHAAFEELNFMGRVTNIPYLARLFQYYLTMGADLLQVLESIAPRDMAEVRKISPDLLELLQPEFLRSGKYHHEGRCEVCYVVRETGWEIYEKREILQQLGDRVSIWVGLSDELAPPNHLAMLEKIFPKARYHKFPERGHLGIFAERNQFSEEMKLRD